MSLLSFPIVDPHIHQWDPYHTPHEASLAVKLLGRFPRLLDKVVRATMPRSMIEMVGLTEHVLSPYLPGNYALDCGPYSVDAVVHVEADWHDRVGLGVVGETRWIAGLPFGQSSCPELGAIVGTADPASADFEKILLTHRAASPLIRGIRRMAAHHPDPGVHAWCKRPGLYVDPVFLKGFSVLAQQGLSFDAWTYSVQLPDVIWLASRFPEVPLVLNHLATPVGVFGPVGRFTGRTVGERAGIFSKWQHDIAMLAEHKHVHAKISGLLMPMLGHTFHKRRELADVDTIVNLLAPFVEHAIKVFGYERLMFASNFPMDKVTARLPDIIEAHARLVAPHGDVALKAIFNENARRFYAIGSTNAKGS